MARGGSMGGGAQSRAVRLRERMVSYRSRERKMCAAWNRIITQRVGLTKNLAKEE